MACVEPISCGFEDNDDRCPILIDDVTENDIFETIQVGRERRGGRVGRGRQGGRVGRRKTRWSSWKRETSWKRKTRCSSWKRKIFKVMSKSIFIGVTMFYFDYRYIQKWQTASKKWWSA